MFDRLAITTRRMTRGFLFLPAALSCFGIVLAVLALLVDSLGWLDGILSPAGIFEIDRDGAESVLGTISGAMMTVLSLVYSLTLVVFTLAAGNIAPRLLETFTDNRVNQVTVGLLGATFLYSLLALHGITNVEAPRVTVVAGMMLATVSFFWVVYFVHDTAQRIMVDNEIGRVQRSLRSSIDRLLADEPTEADGDRQAIPDREGRSLPAVKTGYVTAVDAGRLMDVACRCDGFIQMLARPGRFLIEGEPLAILYDIPEDRDADLHAAVMVSDARAPEGDIQFSIHLNVEIALKALSPGVNDAYTAISAIDHLSGSLARILQRGAPSALTRDKDGTPRVWHEIIPLDEIVGTALHPLRRASAPNLLVMMKFIEAIQRMALVSDHAHTAILRMHLRLIAADMKREVENRDDRNAIAALLWSARRTALGKSNSIG